MIRNISAWTGHIESFKFKEVRVDELSPGDSVYLEASGRYFKVVSIADSKFISGRIIVDLELLGEAYPGDPLRITTIQPPEELFLCKRDS